MNASMMSGADMEFLSVHPSQLAQFPARLMSRIGRRSPSLVSLGLNASVVPGVPPHRELIVPTDLLFCAWRDLFPAERMMFVGGRTAGGRMVASSAWDVTGSVRSAVHVKASPERLGRSLLDVEASGARLVAWLHSHPGTGPRATLPSVIDRNQDEDLRRDFGEGMVGFIATRDGYVRAWGRAIEQRVIRMAFQGVGVEPVAEEPNVYRLAAR